jgi:hypothetical protein
MVLAKQLRQLNWLRKSLLKIAINAQQTQGKMSGYFWFDNKRSSDPELAPHYHPVEPRTLRARIDYSF